MTYEILVEVDMYPRRSNTYANVDKFTQNRGCEGKAHNWGFAGTIHTLNAKLFTNWLQSGKNSPFRFIN